MIKNDEKKTVIQASKLY